MSTSATWDRIGAVSGIAFAWTGIPASAPLVASNMLKITYDIMLWIMYHNVTLSDEQRTEPTTATE